MRFKSLNNHGYTLIEMVMVIVILGVIGAFTFSFVADGVRAFQKSRDRKELYDQGRLALERMVRELRDGYEVTDCSDTSITFRVAHPAAFGVVDEIKYQLNGTDLERVGDPSGTPLTAVLASNVTEFPMLEGVTGGGGIVVTPASTDTVTAGATNMTIAHTVSGSYRLMLVGVSMNNDGYETVTGVTWNGTALTLVGTEANDDDARVEIWRLVAPSTGTHNVVVTFSAALEQEAHAGVMTFAGVDQDTPLGAFVSDVIDDTTPATVDIPSAPGELVFGVVCSEYEALTASSGQTEQWNLAVSSTYGAGGTDAGAATVTMSWDLDAAQHWAMGGVSIKPTGAAPPTCSGGGGGSITLDNKTDRYNSGTGTLTHAIGSGSGNNRLLVVSYGQESASTITAMTYDGVAMTKIHREYNSDGAQNVTEMWYMLDNDMPASGGTYNVSMSVTGGNNPGIVVLSFEGVAQQAPETYNSSQYISNASDRSTTQLSNVSSGSLIVSVACNGSSSGYDGSVGGAGGAGIRRSEGGPSSAGMGVSTDLSSAGGTFNVVEISELSPTNTLRATHIAAAFAPVPASSPSLVTLGITLTDPTDSSNTVTMRTKVFMRNMPPT